MKNDQQTASKQNMKIVFMGTPEFAVPSLEILLKSNHQIVVVITAPDRQAGRGLKLQESAVKQCAVKHGIKVLQPINLKDPDFLKELQQLEADLQVVVAFRMLPQVVWQMPVYGTFNLHGSLLPQYRGASPINYAIINGEQETGVTTFFLNNEIDTGKIIFQEKCIVGPDETAGELHDRLMIIGADLVLKTVDAIVRSEAPQVAQDSLQKSMLQMAPKIFKETCQILWDKPIGDIHNLIRGLSPYPSAFTVLETRAGKMIQWKILRSIIEPATHALTFGTIVSDNKKELKIAANGGFIKITSIRPEGKNTMTVAEYLRGFDLSKLKNVVLTSA